MELIKKIFETFHVVIEEPKSYDTFHLLFIFYGLVVVALLAYFLRNTNEKQNKIVLLTCSLILILSEIYKQLYYVFILGEPGYDWNVIPFQLCSVPMYLCFIVVFLKPGKVKNAMYNFLAIFNMFGGAISFTEPSGLLHPNLFLTAHSCVWHMLLVFIGVYLMVTKRAATKLKDYLGSMAVFGCVASFAQIFNIIFMNKDVNLFYISPFKPNPIAVFRDFWYIIGPWATMILYIACILAGAFIFFAIILYSCKLIKLIVSKIKLSFE